jgi:hypothetical protein
LPPWRASRSKTWNSGEQKQHDFNFTFVSLPSYTAKVVVLEKLYAPSKHERYIRQNQRKTSHLTSCMKQAVENKMPMKPRIPIPHDGTHLGPKNQLLLPQIGVPSTFFVREKHSSPQSLFEDNKPSKHEHTICHIWVFCARQVVGFALLKQPPMKQSRKQSR